MELLASCAMPRVRVPKTASDMRTWVSSCPDPATHAASTVCGRPERKKVTERAIVCAAWASNGPRSLAERSVLSIRDKRKLEMETKVHRPLCASVEASRRRPMLLKKRDTSESG